MKTVLLGKDTANAIFFELFSCAIRLGGVGQSVSGREQQEGAVSPAVNGTVWGAHSAVPQQPEHKCLTQAWQLLMEALTLEPQGLTRGSALYY